MCQVRQVCHLPLGQGAAVGGVPAKSKGAKRSDCSGRTRAHERGMLDDGCGMRKDSERRLQAECEGDNRAAHEGDVEGDTRVTMCGGDG